MELDINFVTVCVGDGEYDERDVLKMQRMIQTHYDQPHTLTCLVDSHDRLLRLRDAGIRAVSIARLHLPQSWWAKMAIFHPEIRGPGRCIYLDLDTVILGDLTALTQVTDDFAICENFTRAAGNLLWPCKYGSCAMVLKEGFGVEIWSEYNNDREQWHKDCPRGDQEAIQKMYKPSLLQPQLPLGYFVGYRDLTDEAPQSEAAIIVFGGRHRPHNSRFSWVKDAWNI